MAEHVCVCVSIHSIDSQIVTFSKISLHNDFNCTAVAETVLVSKVADFVDTQSSTALVQSSSVVIVQGSGLAVIERHLTSKGFQNRLETWCPCPGDGSHIQTIKANFDSSIVSVINNKFIPIQLN